ncbi:MAG TPA: hypothetical protein VLX33_01595 [Nitrososphaerales archaeon]|nr:hypothetical protein [Nitrososphaerales archaeon]
MPELWIPYGNVETLVTLQAENLGVVAEGAPEGGSTDLPRASELVKGATQLFICDSAPPTLELLKGIAQALGESPGLRVHSPAPKRVENAVPELKGRVTTLPPPLPTDETGEPAYALQLLETGTKLFIGSARPDPLFGITDAKVQACLDWVARSQSAAAKAIKGMEPQPFQKTEAYEKIEELAARMKDAKFLTAIPRGGRLWTAMEDAPFDAIRNGFTRTQMPQARGMVIGAGGRGYDDTLSSALRGIWGVIGGVRKTGSVLLVAECSEGVGSTALEMLVTDRMEGERRRERYVDGLEEVFYLNKLKDEYDVLLLSGLPETYARSKLGLTTARGSAEAVGRVLNKVGRSGKMNVVPRAPEFLVELG